MKERSSQNSSSYIDWIVRVNPLRVRQGKDRQGRRLITMSNIVVTSVWRWFADYYATTAAMNDLASSLAKVSAIQSIKVNTLSSSSTVIGRLKSLFQQAGLIVCRCALSRLRCHYGLARSGKGRKGPNVGRLKTPLLSLIFCPVFGPKNNVLSY